MVELWNLHPARVVAFLLPVAFVLWRTAVLFIQFRKLKREGLVGNYVAQAIFGVIFASLALVMCKPDLVGLSNKDVGLESPDDVTVVPVTPGADPKNPKVPSEVKFRGGLLPARDAIVKDDWAALARIIFDLRTNSREFERDTEFLLSKYSQQLGREYVVLGRTALERGDAALGRKYLDYATQYVPEEPDGYLLRAASLSPDEWKLALADLDVAIRRCKDGDPRLTAATEKRLAIRLAHNDPRGALEDVDQLLSQHPDDMVRLAQRGQLRLAAGAVDGAIADLSTASAAVPNDLGLKLELASARLKKDDSPEQATLALGELNKVIAGGTDTFRARLLRGRAHYQLKHRPDALADLSKAIQLDSKSADAYYYRGRVKNELDQVIAAKSDFTQAIQLNPDHRAALFWRGYVTMDREPKNALIDFAHAYELEADPWSLFYKGECLLAIGRRDEAEAAYTDALTMARATDQKLMDRINKSLERLRLLQRKK